jgi:acyl-homoserine lactone acylase PvdQ
LELFAGIDLEPEATATICSEHELQMLFESLAPEYQEVVRAYVDGVNQLHRARQGRARWGRLEARPKTPVPQLPEAGSHDLHHV